MAAALVSFREWLHASSTARSTLRSALKNGARSKLDALLRAEASVSAQRSAMAHSKSVDFTFAVVLSLARRVRDDRITCSGYRR